MEHNPTSAWSTGYSFGCRVLVIEPNEASAVVAVSFLESLGAVPIRVRRAEEAPPMVANRPRAELILLTINSRQVAQAVEAASKIRALEADAEVPRTPIVALTTLSERELKANCPAIKFDFDAYVSIPFSRAQLFTGIQQYLNLNRDRCERGYSRNSAKHSTTQTTLRRYYTKR